MKIAHITDFHLRHHLPGTSEVSTRLSRQMPALLERAAEQVALEKPDLVAITGDLLDYPLDGFEDAQLQQQGRQDLLLIKEIFQRLDCPLAVVYGNHDHPQLFEEVFGSQADLVVGNYRILSFYDQEGAGNIPRRLGAQRQRFEAALADLDKRPQIHLQHYLTAPQHNEGYPHSYLDATDMQAALSACAQVRLVLSGHYHGGADLFEVGGVHYSTARAFAEDPHTFRLYQIDEKGIEQREVALGGEGG